MTVVDEMQVWTFNGAMSRCEEMGGVVATPTSLGILPFYLSIAVHVTYYIGIKDTYDDIKRLTYLNGK